MTETYEKFSREKLKQALLDLNSGKAPGLDGIPAEAIKETGKVAGEWLLEVMNRLLSKQTFPNSWKTAKLVLIPNGNPGDDKYRSICLLNSISKLYESLMKQRLEEERVTKGYRTNNSVFAGQGHQCRRWRKQLLCQIM